VFSLQKALQFSPEAIFSTLIAPRKDIAEEQKHVYLLWYMDIANLLPPRLLRAPVAASAFIPLQTECRDLYVVVI